MENWLMASFQCQLCAEKLRSEGSLFIHLKACSDMQMNILFQVNQCLQCQNSFLSRELLLVHINTCSAEKLRNMKQYEQIDAAYFGPEVMSMHAFNSSEVPQDEDQHIDADNLQEYLPLTIKRENLTVKQEKAHKRTKVESNATTHDGSANPTDDDSLDDEMDLRDNISSHDASNANENKIQAQSRQDMEIKKGDKLDDNTKYGDNLYHCELCDKSYSSANILKSHNDTIHLGKTGFHCNLCGIKVANERNIKMHDEAVHQGIKNFKCNTCEKSFSQRSSLRTHDESVHQGMRFTCNKCGKSFSGRTNFSTHLKSEEVKEKIQKT